MQQSQIIVSCLSTALLEAFGIGKKILFCNFTGTGRYHQDLDPLIVATDSSYDSLSERLDELIGMPHAEYAERYQQHQKYYMSNPADKPTYRAIAEKMDEIISLTRF